jgi:glyoxylase-like metal-dependent hydrolase (beta-lactamase superfamily II)
LVESGPHSTLPQLRAGVAELGYELEAIQHVFLTHIHLDHAGAAWWFARQGAAIYVHPRGSKHLAQPERLMASARRIYQDKMDTLWGQMNAIDSERIREVAHGEIILVGDTNFQAWHTPGHAVHHIAWQTGTALFSGDVAGVRIHAGVVIPPCPPPDIDLADWHQSLALLRSLHLETLYLTHFGPVPYSAEHLTELEERLQQWADWIRPYLDDPRGVAGITPLFQQMVMEDLVKAGIGLADQAKYEAANPSWMSVAGLLRYWQKKRVENEGSGSR